MTRLAGKYTRGSCEAGRGPDYRSDFLASGSRGLMYELLGPLFLFAAAMSLTPGPNVIMVTASAANFGFRRVIPHMLGITLGFASLLTTVGLGLVCTSKAVMVMVIV